MSTIQSGELFLDLPNERLLDIVRPLSVYDLVAVTSTSTAWRQRIVSMIVDESELISQICSKAITYKNEEALLTALNFYAEFVNRHMPALLHLTIDLDTMWTGTENALAKIAELFLRLDTITFTHPHKECFKVPFCPVLPSCIKKLVIDKVD